MLSNFGPFYEQANAFSVDFSADILVNISEFNWASASFVGADIVVVYKFDIEVVRSAY
jgi:hypothetical protein